MSFFYISVMANSFCFLMGNLYDGVFCLQFNGTHSKAGAGIGEQRVRLGQAEDRQRAAVHVESLRRRGAGDDDHAGEFILIITWAISMTSCFVHRSSWRCSPSSTGGR